MRISPNSRKLGLAAFAIIALLLAVAAIFLLRKPSFDFEPAVGRAILPPQKIPPFNLIDQHGKPFTNERLAGHWTLATTGFTYCPDICPTTLMEIAAFYKQLEAMPGERNIPEFVFFSVDPFRDPPEILGNYVEYFHKGFIGVTGKPENIHSLVTELGLFYVYTDQEDDHFLNDVLHKPAMEDYGVAHSARLLIISPEVELVAIMTPPFKPGNILAILEKLQKYYGD